MITTAELRARRLATDARTGRAGPLPAALHLVADQVGAYAGRRARFDWSTYRIKGLRGNGRGPWGPRPTTLPPASPSCWLLYGYALNAAYGAASREEMSATWRRRRSDRAARARWAAECSRVYREVLDVLQLYPSEDAPLWTASLVREAADRLASATAEQGEMGGAS